MSSQCNGEVCDNRDCPCPRCHGNPKKHLSGDHSCQSDPKTGAIRCPECGTVGTRG